MDEKLLKIIELIKTLDGNELVDALKEYHEADIANAVEELDQDLLDKLYQTLPNDMLSEIFANLEEVSEYAEDIPNEKLADIIEEMDSDDAIRLLDELEEDDKQEIILNLESDVKEDIELIDSYDSDEVGSLISTDFLEVESTISVKVAMRKVIEAAKDIEDFSVIYVKNPDGRYLGLVLLKDLIRARSTDSFADLVKEQYPELTDHMSLLESRDVLLDYDLDSMPVLNSNNELIGIITKDQIIYVLERERTEDYNKLAGISSSDFNETVFERVKKRIPWLILLLIIGLFVSAIASSFEEIIIALTSIVFFQSLVQDMGGNVGTQSLAITIQGLDEQENSFKKKIKMLGKEALNGFLVGLCVAVVGFIVVMLAMLIMGNSGAVVYKTATVVALSLLSVATISSVAGTLIPIILSSIKIDPAAASGPFITTVSDIFAILLYYGLATLFFYII